VLHEGQQDLTILYQARITNRIAKFLGIFGAAKSDRLGVTSVTPLIDGNEDGE